MKTRSIALLLSIVALRISAQPGAYVSAHALQTARQASVAEVPELPRTTTIHVFKEVTLQDPPGAPFGEYQHYVSWSPDGTLLTMTDGASHLCALYQSSTGKLLRVIDIPPTYADTLAQRKSEFGGKDYLPRSAVASGKMDMAHALRGQIWNAKFLNDSVLLLPCQLMGIVNDASKENAVTTGNSAAIMRLNVRTNASQVSPLESEPDSTEPLGEELVFPPQHDRMYLSVWNTPQLRNDHYDHGWSLAEYTLDGKFLENTFRLPAEVEKAGIRYGEDIWPLTACDSNGALFVGYSILEHIYRPLQKNFFTLQGLGKSNQPYLDTLGLLRKKYGKLSNAPNLNMTVLWHKKPIFVDNVSMKKDGNIIVADAVRITENPWFVQCYAQTYNVAGELLETCTIPWQTPVGEVSFSTYCPQEKAIAVFRISKTSGFHVEYGRSE